MNLSAEPSNGAVLPICPRRDRNYVYFPDAIEQSLKLFVHGQYRNLNCECYKMSDQLIIAREEALAASEPSPTFGRLTWEDESGLRSIALYETGKADSNRYDLIVPKFDFAIHDRELKTEMPSALFASLFHRWAVLCKNLYHSLEGESRRILLQRIAVQSQPKETDVVAESVRLDFRTKDHFMKFSIHHDQMVVGQVIAAAKVFE